MTELGEWQLKISPQASLLKLKTFQRRVFCVTYKERGLGK